jgi:cytoskeletal protein RodZ
LYADPSIGPSGTELNLSAIRNDRGLSLRDIADRTKIGTAYLTAIENERFDYLPGFIYSVSYIRQYASAINYDADAILRLYRDGNSAEATPVPAARKPILIELCRAISGLIAGAR